MTTVAYEVVRQLGDNNDGEEKNPSVHVSRPSRDGRRFGSLAQWVVTSVDGAWLALGTVETFASAPARLAYATDVPAQARTPLELAVSRALIKWVEIQEAEAHTREHLERKLALLKHAEMRLADTLAEIEKLKREIVECKALLP